MSWFSNLSKALKFMPVIADALVALEDGKLESGEIILLTDEALDAIGISGLDADDIRIEPMLDGSGGFAVIFSGKAAKKLSVSL